jgi:hypothetical protein
VSHAVEMAADGMIWMPSFMAVGLGMQVMLRFFFDNSRGCNVGITNGRNL